MSDQYSPTMIGQLALDAAGVDFILGDIEEGSAPAQRLLRAYGDCVRQLLRTAPWNFARKQTPLLCLADATGQTPNVGNLVPGSQFCFSYALPLDSAFIRYLPWYPFLNPGVPSNNIVPPDSSAPVMEGLTNAVIGHRPIPARFLVTGDTNYIPSGAGNSAPGIAPTSRTVILTNVPPQMATVVYTYEAMFPNLWSISFRQAVIAYLASEVALPLNTDKKMGIALRDRNIAIAIDKIKTARVNEGKESWSSSDIAVDWMNFRRVGGYGPGWGGAFGNIGLGDWNCGWDSIGLSNGSAY